MGFVSGLDHFRTPALLEERVEVVAKYKAEGPDKEREIPEGRLLVS